MWPFRRLPFYRSQVSRVAMILTGIFNTVMMSPAGPPQWKHSQSLLWLDHHYIPFWLLAVAFGIYTVLILIDSWPPVTAAGCILGMAIYTVIFLAAVASGFRGVTANPIGASALLLAVVFHYHAGRLAYIDHESS